jgi:rhodanese-related sulfurtransferase
MKRVVLCVAFLSLAVVGAVFVGGVVASAQQDIPRMTKEDLKPLLGNADVVIIDVRSKPDWEENTLMIKAAVREDPTQVASWMDKYPKDKTLVFYCA